ncbi:unnamed protein product [Calypogeia fissa]
MSRAEASSSKSLQVFTSSEFTRVNDSVYELYKPPGTPDAQIVLFHGLHFDNYSDAHVSTWNSADGSCVWPQKWLAEEFPNVSVFSVSYGAAIRKCCQVMDMINIGENLVSDLINSGIGQTPYCPVILVGHSLGGMVIKQLCSQAHDTLHKSQGSERLRLEKFLQSVSGVFFYATPHGGSEYARKLANNLNGPLMTFFKVLSTDTARLNQNFNDIRTMHYKWLSAGVGETLPTRVPKILGLPEYVLIVAEASARGENFNLIGDVDHLSICKPKGKTFMSFYKLKDFISLIIEESKMLAVSEILTAAQNKLGDIEMDWYGILQVKAGADDSMIESRHRRLAQLLQADKNMGAEAAEAFVWLGKANDILSDKEKRAAYDGKLAVLELLTVAQRTLERMGCTVTNSTHNTDCPQCKTEVQVENYANQCPNYASQYMPRANHNTTIREEVDDSGQHLEACRQELSSNWKQPAKAAFDGTTVAIGFTNFQTDQNAKTETIEPEKEKALKKRKEMDEAEKEETHLKKARRADREGEVDAMDCSSFEGNEDEARPECQLKVDVVTKMDLKGKNRDSDEEDVEDLEHIAKRAKSGGEANPKDAAKKGEEGEREYGRQQSREFEYVAAKYTFDRVKRGKAGNRGDEWYRRTNIAETYGGCQPGVADLNPCFRAEPPKTCYQEILQRRERNVADERQRRYTEHEFLARDGPRTAASIGVSGSGGATAADDYMNKASPPSSKLNSDGIIFLEQGVGGSGGEGLHGPANVGNENNGDGGLGFTNVNSSSGAERARTYRLAAALSVAVPLLLASELLRSTQILLPMQNESQGLVDFLFFFLNS